MAATSTASSTHLESQAYKYAGLNEDIHQIRLVTLIPGVSPEPIHISLENVPLGSESTLEFEALSYTWGSTQDLVSILVDEGSRSYVLMVTKNLLEALQHLRLEHESRVFWIDAICINQQDLAERSAQVKRMADIYTRADRVVIWLGPEADNSSMALDLMKALSAHVKADWITFTMTPTSVETHWADRHQELPYSETQARALTKVFERSWFGRLWIIQEVWLAGPSAIIVCGHASILWSTFRNALFCILQKYWTENFPRVSSTRHSVLSNLGEVPVHRFFDYLIGLTRYSQCQDPRDRIFALLSLLDPVEEGLGIEPNYEKSVAEIYIEVFLSYTKRKEGLYLLRTSGIRNREVGLPTWIPDWSNTDSFEEYHLGYASACYKPAFEVLSNEILRIHGVSVTSVGKIAQHNITPDSPDTAKGILAEIQTIIDQLAVDQTQAEAFCNTISYEQFSDRFHPKHEYYPNRQASLKVIHSMIVDPDSHGQEGELQARMYAATVRGHLGRRSAFRTTSGNFGVGPSNVSTGDLIVVFLGCPNPMVLRPYQENTYSVVGPVYCPGIMAGEVLLGDLPENFRFIHEVLPDNGGTYPRFLHELLGEIHVEDPRLGPLPEGWKLDNHEMMGMYSRFSNEHTGETTYNDPRAIIENVEKRGINLRTFDLV